MKKLLLIALSLPLFYISFTQAVWPFKSKAQKEYEEEMTNVNQAIRDIRRQRQANLLAQPTTSASYIPRRVQYAPRSPASLTQLSARQVIDQENIIGEQPGEQGFVVYPTYQPAIQQILDKERRDKRLQELLREQPSNF